jgi:putative DNA primase/helicase
MEMRDGMMWAYFNGYSLFPLKHDSKRPAVDWGEYIHRVPTYEEYKRWADAGLFSTGYGIVTGAISGVSVLDVDIPEGGLNSLGEKDINILDILTWKVNTPNGLHFYFSYNKGAKQGVARLGKGVDIRNDGGFVVGPGSTVQGKKYDWAAEFGPEEVDLSNVPGWLLQGEGRRIDKTLSEFSEPIRNGERNSKLSSLAGALFAKQMPEGVVKGVLEYINLNYTDTPIDDKELGSILASIRRYHV